MIDENKLIDEIKKLENTYPKDIFLWGNEEECNIRMGRLNEFCFNIVKNTRNDIISLIQDQEEISKTEG